MCYVIEKRRHERDPVIVILRQMNLSEYLDTIHPVFC
jgi:hypothetical protein